MSNFSYPLKTLKMPQKERTTKRKRIDEPKNWDKNVEELIRLEALRLVLLFGSFSPFAKLFFLLLPSAFYDNLSFRDRTPPHFAFRGRQSTLLWLCYC